jgi:hypothetical protein
MSPHAASTSHGLSFVIHHQLPGPARVLHPPQRPHRSRRQEGHVTRADQRQGEMADHPAGGQAEGEIQRVSAIGAREERGHSCPLLFSRLCRHGIRRRGVSALPSSARSLRHLPIAHSLHPRMKQIVREMKTPWRIRTTRNDDGVFISRFANAVNDIAGDDHVGERRIIRLLAAVEFDGRAFSSPQIQCASPWPKSDMTLLLMIEPPSAFSGFPSSVAGVRGEHQA